MLLIAGRWPRRLESAKECVTTHLPKHVAPKTDGAQAGLHKPVAYTGPLRVARAQPNRLERLSPHRVRLDTGSAVKRIP
jgi:hypothetical protein